MVSSIEARVAGASFMSRAVIWPAAAIMVRLEPDMAAEMVGGQ